MIGVLEEDGAVGVAVDAGVVALLDEDVSLALFLHLAFDEFDDVRVIDIEDHHFGGAPRLATALDNACEGVETLHEADGTRGNASTGEGFLAAAQGGEIRAGAGAPLEKHALGAGQAHDRFHVVLHGIDEAGGALWLGLHADVEPDRRVERHFLLDEQVGELVAESLA